MNTINDLVQKQRDIFVSLSKLESRYENKNVSDITLGYANSLACRLDEMFKNFDDQHNEIMSNMHANSFEEKSVPYFQEEIYFEFIEKYFTFKGKVHEILSQNNITSPLSSTLNSNAHGRVEPIVKIDSNLPKISLPKFSGDYMEWIPFRDIYFSLVHENSSLTKIQKFFYLKGTLIGEASNLIKSISATEANYDSAWSILESRYHNKRLIVGNLIAKLFNIEKSDGSFQAIKTLHDSAKECLASLENMNIETNSWDPLLIYLISQKLDIQTRKDWEQSLKCSIEIPKRSEMFDFLERSFRTLESLHEEFPQNSKILNNQKFTKNNKGFSNFKKASCHTGKFYKPIQSKCLYCDKNHSISKCYTFLALSLHDKNVFIKNKNICRNCLSTGHNSSNCGSPFRCMTCKQSHHTLLHDNNFSSEKSSNENNNITLPKNNSSDIPNFTSHSVSSFQKVLLYTIRLIVQTPAGKFPLRALLDPGSQGSLITESAVQLLKLKKIKSQCNVVGIGNNNLNIAKYYVNIDLFSRSNNLITSCSALVLNTLSSYTPEPSSKNISLPNINSENLADPYFYKSDKIDIILGSDICSKIKIPTESFIHNDLFFQNTYFGWVFSGASKTNAPSNVYIHNVNLENILRSFWEQEEVSSERALTSEELACENYFKTTTKYTDCGRYMVNLPFKSILNDHSEPILNNNNIINAFKRLKQLEISFAKRPLFSEIYKKFMHEYEKLGHMSKIGTYPKDVRTNSYFLPHHGVFKEDSTTTKLRVVFDGSSHINGNSSINELLSCGPALQNDLPSIMTQWRRHKIAFGADIEKMFRQIDVHPEHRKFQQILWRFDSYDEICIYELNTVTYGTTCAPYLAIRVIQQIANDFKSLYPNEAKILLQDSYVDDILSGADSIDEAKTLHTNLCSLLSKGGCNLRKWITNSKQLFDFIPEEFRESSLTLDFENNNNNVVKTLGIKWDTTDDSFLFKININEITSVTKRTILSETASLYDPLGWLTPSTVVAKSIFKSLWEHGVDWDSKIPESIHNNWLKYRSSLPDLENLKIPRWINWSKNSKLELHCFCDASTFAYAAVVYSRILNSEGIFVNILQAKSKVTPIRTVTIPRLELCAATLLIKLTEKVKNSFKNIHIDSIHYWSDSSTVLSWIRKSPSNWSVYVANRVSEIQKFSNPLDWRYVPSSQNPADCASRGIYPNDLVKNKTWWYGPDFLYKDSNLWPNNLSNLYTIEEKRKTKITTHNGVIQYPDITLKYSKYHTLIRINALCLRFIYNCKNKNTKRTGFLNNHELNNSLLLLVKLTQKIDFPNELNLLSKNIQIKNSSILKLMPFLDDDGIIRVGGRLQNSNLPYDVKHPILLSKSNPLSRLIILNSHENTLHGGLTLTMSYVNRKYWIVSGNALAKSIIHGCIQCFKLAAKTSTQIMGNLPNVRLNVTRPFKHSGVDYAGPITIKASSLRTASTSKGYICLFICMVTKAIHLEAVSDLTTTAFLAAFRRFISRRGSCTDIYSDCGTNFVGASKELQVLQQKTSKSLPNDIQQSLSQIGTNWHFNPPASPNFGGLWEAGVKSTKFHLKRIMGDRILNFEELTTLLCQIESCLNSRPLAPLSADPADFDALTPAHFLIGEPTTCIQEPSLLDKNMNCLTRWKAVEKMKQHFWKRWYGEYLNRLQSRPKWLVPKNDAKIGDLVLIADERSGAGKWPLGRITEIHPGTDKHTRVVSVLTKNKIIKRPITKICFLPEHSHKQFDSIHIANAENNINNEDNNNDEDVQ